MDLHSESNSDASCRSDQVSDSDDSDEMFPNGLRAIEPYQFEPDASSSDESIDQEMVEAENNRLQNLDWCQCGNCQIMDRREECICCCELQQIINKNAEVVGQTHQCIVHHPGFTPVCLIEWVLETAWYQYRQQYSDHYEGPMHKQNRHIAYRQLARWCWGFLGFKVRVVLPSCAVSCIRAHFPPPGLEEDFHFTGFLYAD